MATLFNPEMVNGNGEKKSGNEEKSRQKCLKKNWEINSGTNLLLCAVYCFVIRFLCGKREMCCALTWHALHGNEIMFFFFFIIYLRSSPQFRVGEYQYILQSVLSQIKKTLNILILFQCCLELFAIQSIKIFISNFILNSLLFKLRIVIKSTFLKLEVILKFL